MRQKLGFVAVVVVLAVLGFALAGAVAHGAPSHQSGCHSQHTCPQLKRKVCKHVMTLKRARAAIRVFKNTQG
jgi:hypothetical protein